MPPIVKDVTIRFTGDDKDLKRANATLDQTNQKINSVATTTQTASSKIVASNQQTAQSFSNMNGVLNQLKGQILATFSVGVVLQFAKTSLEAFRDAEATAKKLSFAIRQIANGNDGDIDKLIKQSKVLQETGIFSDDDIQKSQTMLVQFGLTVDEVEGLIPKIQDLAAAQGIDLAQATDKVILGINGQTKGLRDAGIAFKDTGSKTENLAILMEKLGKFTGSTADALETSAGKAANLNNKFNDLQETIGEKLSQGLDGVKASIVDMVGIAENLDFSFEGIATATIDAFKSLTEYSTAGLVTFEGSTADAIKIQREFNEALKEMSASFGGDTLLALKIQYQQLGDAIADGSIGLEEFKIKYASIVGELKKITETTTGGERDDKTLSGQGKEEEEKKKAEELFKKMQELKKDQLRRIREIEAMSFEEGIERDRALLKVKFDQELEDVEGYTETANQLRLELREQYFRDLEDLEKKERERIAAGREKDAEDIIKEREKEQKEQEKRDEEELDRLQKLADERIRIEQETSDALKEIEDAKLDAFSEGFGVLANLAKGNAELQNKILAFEKLASVIEIIVNLQREKAANSAAAAAASLINPTLSSVYLARAVALNQLATVRAGISSGIIIAQAIPQLALAKGAVSIDGPGTETSDSIPARLSKGETVTSAEKTKKHKSLLLALHNDELEKFINEKYVMPALNMSLGHRWLGSGNSTDSKGFEGIDYKKMGKSMPKSVTVNNIGELAKAMNKEARKQNMFKRRGVSN